MAMDEPSVFAESSKLGAELPVGLSRTRMAGAPCAASNVGKDGSIPRLAPSARTRLLMVATLFGMPYRVMRCAQACNAEIYVLGTSGAWPLRFSRYCRRFFPSDCIVHGDRDEALALEINHLVQKLGITMVLPADAPSTRALIACGDLLRSTLLSNAKP